AFFVGCRKTRAGLSTCAEALFVGWYELAKPMRLRRWVSLRSTPSYGCMGAHRSHSELLHQPLLVIRQVVQRLADLRRLLGLAGQRFGHVADARHVAVVLLGYRALFLGGAGDLQVHVV